jgi:CheY-like chemotaxis protein
MSNKRTRILVVDDEPDFVAYVKTILEEAGHSVDAAFDGEEALARVRSEPPDLVTLDIQMPRKTGVLFYRQMKSDARLRAIPVIVMSGLRQMNDYASSFIDCFFRADRLKVPPPERFLDKPIDRAGLLQAVSECAVRGGILEAGQMP